MRLNPRIRVAAVIAAATVITVPDAKNLLGPMTDQEKASYCAD